MKKQSFKLRKLKTGLLSIGVCIAFAASAQYAQASEDVAVDAATTTEVAAADTTTTSDLGETAVESVATEKDSVTDERPTENTRQAEGKLTTQAENDVSDHTRNTEGPLEETKTPEVETEIDDYVATKKQFEYKKATTQNQISESSQLDIFIENIYKENNKFLGELTTSEDSEEVQKKPRIKLNGRDMFLYNLHLVRTAEEAIKQVKEEPTKGELRTKAKEAIKETGKYHEARLKKMLKEASKIPFDNHIEVSEIKVGDMEIKGKTLASSDFTLFIDNVIINEDDDDFTQAEDDGSFIYKLKNPITYGQEVKFVSNRQEIFNGT